MKQVTPAGWTWTTLEEVASQVPNAIVDGPFGSNLKLSDYVEGNGVPVLQGKNVTGDRFKWFDVRFISVQKAQELKRSSVRVGDILLVKIGSIGYTAILDDLKGFDHAIIPANLAKITPDNRRVDTGYLHHWLKSTETKRYLLESASKTAQPALSLAKFKRLKVPLPPIEEQRRIAAILDQAEALRAKRRQALAKLDTLTQSLFLEMFGDPDSEEFPKESMGKLLDFLTSGSRGWARYYTNAGAQFLRIQNVREGRLDLSDMAHVSAPDTAEAKRTKVREGDVLLSITADLGRTAVVPKLGVDAYINQHLSILRTSKLSAHYLSSYLESSGGKRQIDAKNREGVKAGLNFDDIRSLQIPVPPMHDQMRFAAAKENIHNMRGILLGAISSFDAMFLSLQHRAFRGEL